MSEKKENREEGKERNSSRSGLNDEQIEAALNACTFGYLREKCKNCPLDSDKEPCITNLHLAALEYIGRLKHRAAVAERALYDACCEQNRHWCVQCNSFGECDTSNEICIEAKKHADELIKQAEKELAEERKDDSRGKD